MPLTLSPDIFKIAKILGVPLAPKPILFVMLVVLLAVPLAILYYSIGTMRVPRILTILAVLVLGIYGYGLYLTLKATNIKIGRKLELL